MVSDFTTRALSDTEDCLNPYSTGRWFLIVFLFLSRKGTISLNPYSTGRWFLIISIHLYDNLYQICLNPYSTGRWFLMNRSITLWLSFTRSLNPYSTGRWFLMACCMYLLVTEKKVLILILLEDGF